MMKIAKHACLALAGIGFFSCSNEEIVQPEVNAPIAVDGTAALTVQIVNEGMQTGRAIGDKPSDNNQKITLSKVTVKYLPGGTFAKLDVSDTSKPVVFYDVPKGTTQFVLVGNPVSSTADEAAFSSTSDVETNTVDKNAANATVYGISSTLTEDGTITNGDKTYSNYTATVTVKAVTARMELSGLKFAPKTPTSDFTVLTLEGVFLNDYYNKGIYSTATSEGITVSTEVAITNTPTITDPAKPEENVAFANVKLADWFKTSESDATGESFYNMNGGADDEKTPTLPKDGKVWAYNFFVDANNDAHSLPKFTVVLKPTYASSVGTGYGNVLYAVVTKYQTSGDSPAPITRFEKGKIYKITDLTLPEKVLTPDIGGNQYVGITATVTVEDWETVGTDIDWSGE